MLRCVSRWELLQQMASGMPTDAALFAGPQCEKVRRGSPLIPVNSHRIRQLFIVSGSSKLIAVFLWSCSRPDFLVQIEFLIAKDSHAAGGANYLQGGGGLGGRAAAALKDQLRKLGPGGGGGAPPSPREGERLTQLAFMHCVLWACVSKPACCLKLGALQVI